MIEEHLAELFLLLDGFFSDIGGQMVHDLVVPGENIPSFLAIVINKERTTAALGISSYHFFLVLSGNLVLSES